MRRTLTLIRLSNVINSTKRLIIRHNKSYMKDFKIRI